MSNPVKPTLKTEIIPLVLIVLSIVASFYFYANFPDQVPTHWNYQGEVDDYSSKTFAAFFFPALNVALYLMFLGLPYLDPKKQRYEEFKKVYHVFKGLFIAYMTLLYFYIGLAGLGYPISIGTIVPVSIGFLFLIIGNYMSKIKPNWFMGIRTPWTLENEEVWNKTHRLGGKLFMLLGLLLILSGFVKTSEEQFWPIFVGSVIAVAFIPIVYSFILYKKSEKK